MPFNIVDVESGTLVRYRNRLLEYDTTDEATAKAKELAAKHPGQKYKIKAAAADDSKWIARETLRMQDGTYVSVPFFGYIWWGAALGVYTAGQLQGTYGHIIPLIGICKTHFAHVSMSNKSMLSYTESSEKGAKDIQTQIKPGAYLSKYLGSVLSADNITALVADWQRRYVECELKFARDPADIVRIYQTGPRSCMSGAANEYATRTKGDYRHPCEVYGKSEAFDGDLTLAYLEGKNGVMSRCLVWEEKKQHGRIYGDSTLLTRELKALGYTASGFNGARIAKIPVGKPSAGVFLMPYIDGWSNVLERDGHFLISTGDHLDSMERRKARYAVCCNTNGVTDGAALTIECEGCGDEIEEDNAHNVAHHGHYCDNCYNETFIYCERTGRDQLRDGSEEVVYRRYVGRTTGVQWPTQLWCADVVEVDAFQCPIDGAWFSNDLAVEHEGQTISRRAYEAMFPPAPPAPPPEPIPVPIGPADWQPSPAQATPTGYNLRYQAIGPEPIPSPFASLIPTNRRR